MSSFSQEMLRYLQPELLQPHEMKEILMKRGVPANKLRQSDGLVLLELFKNTAVPKPQRRKVRDNSSENSSLSSKNRIVIKSDNERSSVNTSRNGRRISWSDSSEKSSTAGSDRLRSTPDSSRLPASKTSSSSEKSQTTCRLKPPPDLSQPEQKKIKLNRSSSEALDNIIINDRSKNDSSRHPSESKDVNGRCEKNEEEKKDGSNHSAKKITLKRSFSSSQSSNNLSNEDTPAKKKQPITWP